MYTNDDLISVWVHNEIEIELIKETQYKVAKEIISRGMDFQEIERYLQSMKNN